MSLPTQFLISLAITLPLNFVLMLAMKQASPGYRAAAVLASSAFAGSACLLLCQQWMPRFDADRAVIFFGPMLNAGVFLLIWRVMFRDRLPARSRVKLSLVLTHVGLFVTCLFIIQAALTRNDAISLYALVFAGLTSGLTLVASLLILSCRGNR